MNFCILAGGKSRRMGSDKAFLEFNGRRGVEILLERFSKEGSVCLSSARGDMLPRLEIPAALNIFEVSDSFLDAGPAGGIYSALAQTGEDLFVVAGDMPFASPILARQVMALAGVSGTGPDNGAKVKNGSLKEGGSPDLVVLEGKDHQLEMLFAYYSIRCREPLYRMLSDGHYRLRDLAGRVSSRVISFEEGAKAWGSLAWTDQPEIFKDQRGADALALALMNMNRPEDYYRVCELMKGSFG